MNNPLGRFTLDQLQDGQRIIARAWADEAFKAALLADPMGTLAREGFVVPEGLTIAVHDNTDTTLHVVLPPKPSAVLTDEDLAGAAGGFTFQVTMGTLGPIGPMSGSPTTTPVSTGVNTTQTASQGTIQCSCSITMASGCGCGASAVP